LLYCVQLLSHGIHFVLRNLRSPFFLTSVPAQYAHFPLRLSGSLAGRPGGLLCSPSLFGLLTPPLAAA
jgi:hypothetical protein